MVIVLPIKSRVSGFGNLMIFMLNEASVAKGAKKETAAAPGLGYVDLPNTQIRKVISLPLNFFQGFCCCWCSTSINSFWYYFVRLLQTACCTPSKPFLTTIWQLILVLTNLLSMVSIKTLFKQFSILSTCTQEHILWTSGWLLDEPFALFFFLGGGGLVFVCTIFFYRVTWQAKFLINLCSRLRSELNPLQDTSGGKKISINDLVIKVNFDVILFFPQGLVKFRLDQCMRKSFLFRQTIFRVTILHEW